MGFTRFKNNRAKSDEFDNGGWNSDAHLVIKFPTNRRILHVISRSLFFALLILMLPSIVSILRREIRSEISPVSEIVDSEHLDLLFRYLGHEGFAINGHKALFLSSGGIKGLTQLRVLDGDEHKLDIVVDSDFDRSGLFSDDSFDFVFVWGPLDSDFIDRILRIGGIVVFPLIKNDPSNHFQNKPNYRPLFLSKYSSIIVAMEKTIVYASATRRRLCQLSLQSRKLALRGLEDVLLEPPVKDAAKPNKLTRKIKYLPDIVDGFLKKSTRRLFVTVGLREENEDMIEYFDQNYPSKDEEFEVHRIDLEPEESSSSVAVRNKVSGWLRKNVKEEEYVVMKAEAEVVEKLMEMRTMSLVDELFLECRNQWWEDGGEKKKKSKRAYWQCLSLYGSLKDEGIAVHQWWGL